MPQRTDITKERLLRIIENYDSPRVIMISDVAIGLGCNWVTAKRHIEKYKEVREAFESKVETAIDEAEKVLYEKSKTDTKALMYLLSTKGKKRGYAPPTINYQPTLFDVQQASEGSGLVVWNEDNIQRMENLMTEFQKEALTAENTEYEVLTVESSDLKQIR